MVVSRPSSPATNGTSLLLRPPLATPPAPRHPLPLPGSSSYSLNKTIQTSNTSSLNSKRSIDEYVEAREIEARQHTNSSPSAFTASKSLLTALAGVLGSIALGAMVVL